MSHVRTTQLNASLLVVVLVLLTGTWWSVGSHDPQFSYESITPAQREAITWALGLFEGAGLELPDTTFIGHDERETCQGRDGAARAVDEGAVIDLCTTEIGPTQGRWILHEIAHAWDYHNLDDERRESFLDLRDLKSWREGEWHERGAENAADILVWGLIDRPFRPVHIYDNSCADLLVGYLTLVGEQPLHGYTDLCDQ